MIRFFRLTPSFFRLSFIISLSFLMGCVKEDLSDLEAHVAQIKKEEPSPLTPLPPFPPEPVVLFQCEKENPFENFNKVNLRKIDVALEQNDEPLRPDCKQPDIYVNKHPLEKFPIDSLLVVGTLNLKGEMWGLIQEPDKAHMVHKVKVNDRLGEHFGKIIAITERELDIVEMLPIEDEMGSCYREEMRKIHIYNPNAQ